MITRWLSHNTLLVGSAVGLALFALAAAPSAAAQAEVRAPAPGEGGVAQDSEPADTGAADRGPGDDGAVDLDRLLQLPDSFDPGGERRGGATAAEWRERFARARGEIREAQDALAAAKQELEEIAGDTGSYQVTAPGATNPQNSPVSFKLRQEIRRQTEEVERAQRELRELEVRANLAGVPSDWRE